MSLISSISGVLFSKSPSEAILDVGGIRFLLHISFATYEILPDKGNSVDILTHLHVKEDILDLYGFKDEDGCPDPDNDKDNILDSVDRCPSQPETVNQYQDTDGCPDAHSQPDFDHDGIWDDRDNCPFDPEDKDGVQDDDGCPDPDEIPNWLERLKENESDEP